MKMRAMNTIGGLSIFLESDDEPAYKRKEYMRLQVTDEDLSEIVRQGLIRLSQQTKMSAELMETVTEVAQYG